MTKQTPFLLGMIALALTGPARASADFRIDRSAMSPQYWAIWNDAEQAKIDSDIEANRKADAAFAIDAPTGTVVTVEQLDHEFKFGAHIFNFDQLGRDAYNDAYKASYGTGGIFNSATVAFYWDRYEPVSGRIRAYGDYEDTARFWNSLTREEAMEHPFWRRPAPAPVIDFCRRKGIRIHGHILVWGLSKPAWIYDLWCPEEEKRECDRLGIPRHDSVSYRASDWTGGYGAVWRNAWRDAYGRTTETNLAAKIPTFTANMRKVFRDRVLGVAELFGAFVDSWDVVNESSVDWKRYRKSRTDLPLWFSANYGLMPGDYPLRALLDAKEAFPERAKLNVNDWNIADDFLEQINDLQREGAKIDIVGCQMHIFDTNACARLAQGGSCGNWIDTPKMIENRLDLMAKTGKPIHVSEITITSPGSDAKSRMIQAILTRNAYRKWFSHKAMMGITWWNTVDGGGVKGEPLVSGLFTADMRRKPAYEALDQLINHEWKTKTEARVEGEGEDRVIRFRGFRGKYRLTWTDANGVRRTRDAYLTGDGVKETMKDAWSRVVRYENVDVKRDGYRIVPSVRAFGPVPLAQAKAATLAEVRKLAPGEGRPLTLAEKPADLAALFPDYRKSAQGDGAEAAYLVFKVRAPRAFPTAIVQLNDWYMTVYVNGRKIESFEGNLSNWRGSAVRFEQGENEVVVKTSAGNAGWLATLAVRDPEGELAFE